VLELGFADVRLGVVAWHSSSKGYIDA
jgi:hypothetical protein